MIPCVRVRLPHLQTGATTLAVTVLVLSLATLLSIGVSRTTQMDQRMAANQHRARQAFLAAEAGMAHALALLAARDAHTGRLLGLDRDQGGVADEITPLANRVTGAYRAAYCDPEDAAQRSINCPDAPGPPTCDRLDGEPGTSSETDDSSATAGASASDSPPQATEARYLRTPLIAACGWSDDEIARHLIVQATQALPKVGHEVRSAAKDTAVIHKDTATDAAMFFRQYMGVADLAAYEARLAERVIAADQAAILAEHGGARAEAIVLKGDTVLPAEQTLGSRDQPIVLVIDGDWLGGAPRIWGVVYVRGSIEFVGSPEIHGALIVEGALGETTEAAEAIEALVTYDSEVLDGVRGRIGTSAPKPGTWRDWSTR
ncbi:pilus assembly PilX family protein [Halochromatium salexigens]|uniref:Type 4 fimbrial biogenesis protein PilX N-terminal domain-containing protein n=1 Tax=Halochromatium salexigens TaxID=49447 RepID=A0AAJ0XDM6_HALSE|nr:pilus assembly PilX N-terminal domain-containing protein [Halochromatium salexigens]MBK5929054.1 hypothetical protein [Halochromatium salexigens]